MSAEPLPNPRSSAAPARRIEGLTRSVLGRPVLSLVPTPRRARRAPFVALILGILLAGLIGLLLLNTASAQDAFRLHRLEASAAETADAKQALTEQVNKLTGPSGLAEQAQRMGMVPVGAPTFWKPGDPLPPGARVIDGMLVVPAAAPPAPAASPSAPAKPGPAAVSTVPRPGQATKPTTRTPTTKPSTSTSTSTSTSPSTAPRPGSTAATPRATASQRATTAPSSRPSSGTPSTTTKPSTSTNPTTTKPTTTTGGAR